MLSEATTQLLDLYRGPLRDVRFPDADEGRLKASIESMQSAQEALTHAELAVDAARSALRDQQHMLTQLTERALAYARIYAAGRPELQAALGTVVPSAIGEKPARRGPGRPRKGASPASGTGVLPNVPASASTEPSEQAEHDDEQAAE